MKRTLGAVAMVMVLSAALTAGTAEAQRRGMGPGAGRGAGNCVITGQPLGAGIGRGGGWWLRVSPKSEAEKQLVANVTKLHEEIRATNLEIARLRAANADAGQIAQLEAKVNGLRQQLMEATRKGEPLIRAMGVPSPYGVCDGSGPKGAMGNGRGRGGSGNGLRLRDGTGPNCPLR